MARHVPVFFRDHVGEHRMGMDWPLRPAHHHERIDRRCTRSQYGTSSSNAGLSARCTVVNEWIRPRPLTSRQPRSDDRQAVQTAHGQCWRNRGAHRRPAGRLVAVSEAIEERRDDRLARRGEAAKADHVAQRCGTDRSPACHIPLPAPKCPHMGTTVKPRRRWPPLPPAGRTPAPPGDSMRRPLEP